MLFDEQYPVFCDRGRVDSVFPSKLRFENTLNKKTLKRAWCFFLFNYSFVTTAGFEPATIRAEI